MESDPVPGVKRYVPTVWDRFKGSIRWVECDADDEPQLCVLCQEMKSAGKEFPTDPEDSEFICNACWMPLTMKLMSTPDPKHLPGGFDHIGHG